MRQGLAVSIPTTEQVGDMAKTVAAIVGIVGGAWALVLKILKRRRQERKRLEQEAKAIRYLLDAVRQALQALTPSEQRFYDADEMARQKVLIDQVRDELWILDGHASEREQQRQAEDLMRVLTRTQAIQAKEQDMFRDDEGDTNR